MALQAGEGACSLWGKQASLHRAAIPVCGVHPCAALLWGNGFLGAEQLHNTGGCAAGDSEHRKVQSCPCHYWHSVGASVANNANNLCFFTVILHYETTTHLGYGYDSSSWVIPVAGMRNNATEHICREENASSIFRQKQR